MRRRYVREDCPICGAVSGNRARLREGETCGHPECEREMREIEGDSLPPTVPVPAQQTRTAESTSWALTHYLRRSGRDADRLSALLEGDSTRPRS